MNSESNKEYSVNWKNHMSHVRKAFDHLLTSNELTDVTLCCEGKKIGAHKMLLSACSSYFRDTFKVVPYCQHPVIVLWGVEYGVLSDILHFIYNGEVSVDTSKLDSFLKTAQLLQISGLTDSASDKINDCGRVEEDSSADQAQETYLEPITSASSVNEAPKKGVKRPGAKESETKDKAAKQDDAMLISDVKCEPSELVSFEDPLEDPLLQTDQGENNEFFSLSSTQERVEDDVKTETVTRAQKRIHTFLTEEGKGRKKRRNCVWCYRKLRKTLTSREADKKVKKVSTFCSDCANNPAMCLKCFNEQHCNVKQEFR